MAENAQAEPKSEKTQRQRVEGDLTLAARRNDLRRDQAHLTESATDYEKPHAVATTMHPRPASPQRTHQFEIQGELARGGMGAVLRARDVELRRDIAIKVLLESHSDSTELRQRFVEEAQIAGQLQHPGVVPVYSMGLLPDTRPYFAMKLVEGRTLASFLAARNSLSDDFPRLMDVFAQVCQTLAYVHSRGVVHRDLKPSNVMIGEFGEVLVMDWGLAKVLVRDEGRRVHRAGVPDLASSLSADRPPPDESSEATEVGSVMGTPAYMAPEQANGDCESHDERVDVYGLGAILCEILTGRTPFCAAEIESRRDQLILAHDRIRGCEADASLIALAVHCLQGRPDDRPRNAGFVAAALADYRNSAAERLRQAELAGAAERARAEEAQATASHAEATARAEANSRRLTLALAASIMLAATFLFAEWRIREVERANHAASLNERVFAAFHEAAKLRGNAVANGDAASWAAAAEAGRQASALLEAGVDSGIRSEVEFLSRRIAAEKAESEKSETRRQADDKLLSRLIDVRLGRAEQSDARSSDSAYARVFSESGLDPDANSFEEFRLSMGGRSVSSTIAMMIDDWALTRVEAKKKPEDVQRLLNSANAIDSHPWRRRVRQALATADQKNRLDKLRELANESAAGDQAAENLALLGAALRDDRDFTESERVLRRAQRRRPGDVWINYELGLTLYSCDRIAESIRYFSAARAVRPETSHRLAHALADLGETDEAVAVFRELVAIRPAEGHHWGCLADLLRNSNREDESKQALERGVASARLQIERDPRNITFHFDLGRQLQMLKRFSEAAASFRTILAIDSDYPLAWAGLAAVYLDLGRPQEAVDAAVRARRLNPGDYNNLAVLGAAYATMKDYRNAAEAYRRSIAVHSRQGRAQLEYARALELMNDYQSAITEFRKAAEFKQEAVAAKLGEARSLIRLGRLQEAESIYTACNAAEDATTLSHFEYAVFLAEAGRTSEAAREYRASLLVDPLNAEAHCNLALLLKDRGEFDEAIRLIHRGHELGTLRGGWTYRSDQWIAVIERAAAYAKGGRFAPYPFSPAKRGSSR